MYTRYQFIQLFANFWYLLLLLIVAKVWFLPAWRWIPFNTSHWQLLLLHNIAKELWLLLLHLRIDWFSQFQAECRVVSMISIGLLRWSMQWLLFKLSPCFLSRQQPYWIMTHVYNGRRLLLLFVKGQIFRHYHPFLRLSLCSTLLL